MAIRIVICFPTGPVLALRAEAAHLALALAASQYAVTVIGAPGPWRDAFRRAGVVTSEQELAGDARRITHLLRDASPDLVHAFGAEVAHRVLPAVPAGVAAFVTLGHESVARLSPTDLRTAAGIFVPCDYMREQVQLRLPGISVITGGYLLSSDRKFSPLRAQHLAHELDLDPQAPTILFADVLNGDEADIALALIAAAPALALHIPNAQIVIAGDGPRRADVQVRAGTMNERLGRPMISTPGHREDIPGLLSLAAMAVGCGRFAAEAVAGGVALVAAGPAGLIGTYTPDAMPLAQRTCCGRHGDLPPVTARALASELVGLHEYPQYRDRFVHEGRTTLLLQSERMIRTAQMRIYYERHLTKPVEQETEQTCTMILPDDPRELLFCLPALAALRAQKPWVALQVVVAPGYESLFETLDFDVHVMPKPTGAMDWPNFLRTLSTPRPDLCLCFATDAPSTMLAAGTRAPQRVGFHDVHTGIIFTHQVQTDATGPARAFALLHELGVDDTPVALPEPAIPPAAEEALRLQLLAAGVGDHEPVILLAPEASPAFAWPARSWEILAELLAEDRPEVIAVLDGGGLHLPDRAVPLESPDDPAALLALLGRAVLVVAPDTYLLHLATLVGTPTVGLYGPTAPETNALPGAAGLSLCTKPQCHPCTAQACKDIHCLGELAPAEVFGAIVMVQQHDNHASYEIGHHHAAVSHHLAIRANGKDAL
jgi:ADP-heptose:LPS heptosyltransferase